MSNPALIDVLKKQFPNVILNDNLEDLNINSFPEWDSLAHFNFLMLVEETYSVRFSLDEMAELKGLEDIKRSLISRGISLS